MPDSAEDLKSSFIKIHWQLDSIVHLFYFNHRWQCLLKCSSVVTFTTPLPANLSGGNHSLHQMLTMAFLCVCGRLGHAPTCTRFTHMIYMYMFISGVCCAASSVVGHQREWRVMEQLWKGLCLRLKNILSFQWHWSVTEPTEWCAIPGSLINYLRIQFWSKIR